MSSNKKLYLYEALELRGEYDGRIKTLKALVGFAKKDQIGLNPFCLFR
jgi:hypothetical protein